MTNITQQPGADHLSDTGLEFSHAGTTPRIPASLVVTTYGDDTRYTQLCLEKIGGWKSRHHELIVVVHDASVMMSLYLEYLAMSGLIDKLVHAPSGYGHVAGVNLGFRHARHDVLFNINTDVRVGPGLVDTCAARLVASPSIGLIGWHYNWGGAHDATRWHNRKLKFTLRTRETGVARKGVLDRAHLENIRDASWYTGRVLGAAGEHRVLCANTSFFGIRRRLWNRIGGFDVARYRHYFSDDFLCYAVLEQGYDIENLPEHVRCSQRPEVFESLSDHKYDGIPEPEKHLDVVELESALPPGQQQVLIVRRLAELGARVVLTTPGCARARRLVDSGRVIACCPPPVRGAAVDPRAELVVVA